LTDNERNVLELIAQGHDAKSIARMLTLSTQTVYERLRRVGIKLNAANSREAARIFFSTEQNPDEKLVDQRFVLSDVAFSAALQGQPELLSEIDAFAAAQGTKPTYKAASNFVLPESHLPLRGEGERVVQLSKAERLRAIGELTAKFSVAFAAICLAALVLNTLLARG